MKLSQEEKEIYKKLQKERFRRMLFEKLEELIEIHKVYALRRKMGWKNKSTGGYDGQ